MKLFLSPQRCLSFGASCLVVLALILLAACGGGSGAAGDGDVDGEDNGVEQEIAIEEELLDVADGTDDDLLADGDDSTGEDDPEPEADPEEQAEEEPADPCAQSVGTAKCPSCGRACQIAEDCPPGYTCLGGGCTRECLPDTDDLTINDCGDGWGCHLNRYRYGIQTLLDGYFCARGSTTDCLAASQCSDQGEVCMGGWPALDLDDVVTFCQPPIPCAASVGESCDDETPCSTGWCLYDFAANATFCSASCAADTDCPQDMQCRDLFLYRFISDYHPVIHAFCTPRNQGMSPFDSHDSCFTDDKCVSKDQLCIGLGANPLEGGGYSFARFCSGLTEGAAGLGEVCDGLVTCEHQLCVDGRCSRPCVRKFILDLGVTDVSCPDTMRCITRTFSLAGNSQTLDVCVPRQGTLLACTGDADCTADGEVCGGLSYDSQTGAYVAHCIKPLGNVLFGGVCDSRSDAASKSCRNGLCLKETNTCTIPCQMQDDQCPAGYVCQVRYPVEGQPASVCVAAPAADGDEDTVAEEDDTDGIEDDAQEETGKVRPAVLRH